MWSFGGVVTYFDPMLGEPSSIPTTKSKNNNSSLLHRRVHDAWLGSRALILGAWVRGWVHVRGARVRGWFMGADAVFGSIRLYPCVSTRIQPYRTVSTEYRRPYQLSKDTPRNPIRQLAYRIRISAVSSAYRYPKRVRYGYEGKSEVSE